MHETDLHERLHLEFGESLNVRPADAGDLVDGVPPRIVAAPVNEAAAQQLVKFCGAEKLAILVRGGGSKMHIGARPSRFDVLLTTEKLCRLIEHDEGNATAEVGTGITIASFNAAIAESRQFVALDTTTPAATVGGAMATNHFGPARLKFGMPRDMVVGLRAVLSDGRLVKAGSKVVKNVSGYDLAKLFVGSFGSLGLITSATVRLRPYEEASSSWRECFAAWGEAAKFANSILDGAFEPTALQVAGGANDPWMNVRFDGIAASVAAQMARLPQSPVVSKPTETLGTRSSAESARDSAKFSMRATLLLREAAGWADVAFREGATHVVWDCGAGAVEADFNSCPDVSKLRRAAEERQGIALVTRADAGLKSAEFVWGAANSALALQRELKRRYDGAGVFAPGRTYGGL